MSNVKLEELCSDIIFLLRQSAIIEHKQDHHKIAELRKKYGVEL